MTALQRERLNSYHAWIDALSAAGRVCSLETLRGEIRLAAGRAWADGVDDYGDLLWAESDRIDRRIAEIDAALGVMQ